MSMLVRSVRLIWSPVKVTVPPLPRREPVTSVLLVIVRLPDEAGPIGVG